MSFNPDGTPSITPTQNSTPNSNPKQNDSNMFLVTSQLIGSENYMQWKYSIQIALGAKKKVGFIDGNSKKPNVEGNELDDWTSNDCMVRSWLLNAISKEIVGAFIFAATAHELWNELEEQFSESNGPLIYQLQRQIASINQGDASVSKYYTNLKQLWDQLSCLLQLPMCNCGSAKAMADFAASTRLMQFLMGLNDTFESLRNQILVLDPLPSVHKAYSMALSVEKQKEVQINFSIPTENAMFVKTSNQNSGEKRQFSYKPKNDPKNRNNNDKYCNYCKVNGHTRDACFKLNGYPDWYKDLKDKRKGNANAAHMANTNQHDNNPLFENNESTQDNSESMNALFQQFSQFMKSNQNQKMDSQFANFSHFGDFAGMNVSMLNSLKSDKFDKNMWIIDTGATAHMCSHLSYMENSKKVTSYTPIYLPDGSIKAVTHTGVIELSSKLILKNVLHVPDFKCNLLSVRCLAFTANIVFKFFSTHCILQDLETNEVVAEGKVLGKLYVLDANCLLNIIDRSRNDENVNKSCNVVHSCNVDKDSFSVWHKRLGHSSQSVLKHLKFIPSQHENE
ncbi:hypothetical protein LXL04_006189 [Taraxacum kok-saghyz]